jgi:putative PIG3 family NAD(P)H quinone oxidoreductase
MKAIHVDTNDPECSLHLVDMSSPAVAADEVLVDIVAAGVNRADLSQRAGKYPPPPGASEILGLEVSGTISRLGADVQNWQVGDRVCALLAGGGYAEQVNVPASMLMRIPDGMNFIEAAAIPETFLTAYLNLFVEGGLKRGETVLIHAGASGVGTAAIQLAALAGCRVFVTVGSEEKAQRCRELGAELAVNYRLADFADEVRKHAGGKAVDVILDMVGAQYISRNLELLNIGGRLTVIAFMGGVKAELSLATLMAKRLTMRGSVLRSRPVEEKSILSAKFQEAYWPAFTRKDLRVEIYREFPLAEAESAHAVLRENRNIGKVILRVRDESSAG